MFITFSFGTLIIKLLDFTNSSDGWDRLEIASYLAVGSLLQFFFRGKLFDDVRGENAFLEAVVGAGAVAKRQCGRSGLGRRFSPSPPSVADEGRSDPVA
ncbi:unnamed protein product [Nezara viridula]|uniref:Uncharacterized protein n=1 Tax=Nezara viridula TaxID=85310 RepID=A0A9P0E9W0_NEZVI|nr:unnamed protein product [Nezara viridula]